jgi:hypothetical protein
LEKNRRLFARRIETEKYLRFFSNGIKGDHMYCPHCQAEYVAGVKMCPECGVPLVDDLAEDAAEPEPEETAEEQDGGMEPVYTTNRVDEITLIKSILDDEGIEYIFQGEHFVRAQSLIEPAHLLVRKDQADRVREILAELGLEH